MSYYKEEHRTDFNDDCHSVCSNEPRTVHYALQAYCNACLTERGTTVGCLAPRAKAWFCSGGCMTYHSYKNKLTTYPQQIVSEIIKMENKHFKPEILNKRRKRLGL